MTDLFEEEAANRYGSATTAGAPSAPGGPSAPARPLSVDSSDPFEAVAAERYSPIAPTPPTPPVAPAPSVPSPVSAPVRSSLPDVSSGNPYETHSLEGLSANAPYDIARESHLRGIRTDPANVSGMNTAQPNVVNVAGGGRYIDPQYRKERAQDDSDTLTAFPGESASRVWERTKRVVTNRAQANLDAALTERAAASKRLMDLYPGTKNVDEALQAHQAEQDRIASAPRVGPNEAAARQEVSTTPSNLPRTGPRGAFEPLVDEALQADKARTVETAKAADGPTWNSILGEQEAKAKQEAADKRGRMFAAALVGVSRGEPKEQAYSQWVSSVNAKGELHNQTTSRTGMVRDAATKAEFDATWDSVAKSPQLKRAADAAKSAAALDDAGTITSQDAGLVSKIAGFEKDQQEAFLTVLQHELSKRNDAYGFGTKLARAAAMVGIAQKLDRAFGGYESGLMEELRATREGKESRFTKQHAINVLDTIEQAKGMISGTLDKPYAAYDPRQWVVGTAEFAPYLVLGAVGGPATTTAAMVALGYNDKRDAMLQAGVDDKSATVAAFMSSGIEYALFSGAMKGIAGSASDTTKRAFSKIVADWAKGTVKGATEIGVAGGADELIRLTAENMSKDEIDQLGGLDVLKKATTATLEGMAGAGGMIGLTHAYGAIRSQMANVKDARAKQADAATKAKQDAIASDLRAKQDAANAVQRLRGPQYPALPAPEASAATGEAVGPRRVLTTPEPSRPVEPAAKVDAPVEAAKPAQEAPVATIPPVEASEGGKTEQAPPAKAGEAVRDGDVLWKLKRLRERIATEADAQNAKDYTIPSAKYSPKVAELDLAIEAVELSAKKGEILRGGPQRTLEMIRDAHLERLSAEYPELLSDAPAKAGEAVESAPPAEAKGKEPAVSPVEPAPVKAEGTKPARDVVKAKKEATSPKSDMKKAIRDQHDTWTDAQEAQVARLEKELFKKQGLEHTSENGLMTVLGPSARGDNGDRYQITYIQADGKPSGHRGFSDRKEAIREFMRDTGWRRADLPDDFGFNPEKYHYVYESTMRPVSPGAVPSENLVSTETGGKFGRAVYSKPLTEEQIAHFDLKPVESREPIPAKSAPPAEAKGKEPWEMTREEFEADFRPTVTIDSKAAEGRFQKNIDSNRRRIVEDALREGKPVPPEVLADYPDLKPKEAATVSHVEPAPVKAEGTKPAVEMTAAERRKEMNAIKRSLADLTDSESDAAVDRLSELKAAHEAPKPKVSKAKAPMTGDEFERQILETGKVSEDQAKGIRVLVESFGRNVTGNPEDFIGNAFEMVKSEKASASSMRRAREQAQKGMPPRGGVDFLKSKKAVIVAFEKGDVSTIAHEVGHVFRRWLPSELMAEAEKWAGVKDGKWEIHHDEMFSSAFERYLRAGKAPKGMTRVFDAFKGWLKEVYDTLKNPRARHLLKVEGADGKMHTVKFNAEIKSVFDAMLGEGETYDSAYQKNRARELNSTAGREAATLEKDILRAYEDIHGEPYDAALNRTRELGDQFDTSFRDNLPSELEDLPLSLRRFVKVLKPSDKGYRGATGEDSMKTMGVDTFIEHIKTLADGESTAKADAIDTIERMAKSAPENFEPGLSDKIERYRALKEGGGEVLIGQEGREVNVPFQPGLFGELPPGADNAPQRQLNMGMDKGLVEKQGIGEVHIRDPLEHAAVAEVLKPGASISSPRSLMEALMDRKGWKELFRDPANPLPEATEAFLRATKGKSLFQADAWHGSPHEFDKFSMDKIGTGEGAQAFGHGLYFTSEKEVAEYYRTSGVNGAWKYKGENVYADGGKNVGSPITRQALAELALERNEKEARHNATKALEVPDGPIGIRHDVAREMLRLLDSGEAEKPKGNVYKVTLWKGRQENLLDWDKPVDSAVWHSLAKSMAEHGGPQARMIRAIAKYATVVDSMTKWAELPASWHKANERVSQDNYDTMNERRAKLAAEIADTYKNEISPGVQMVDYQWTVPSGVAQKLARSSSGKEFYQQLSGLLGSDKDASMALMKAGVDGIRYNAGQLSGGGKGTNYVVFDENAASIESRTLFQPGDSSSPAIMQLKEQLGEAAEAGDKAEVHRIRAEINKLRTATDTESTTGISLAKVEEARAKRGLEPVEDAAVLSNQEALAKAKKIMADDKKAIDHLVDDLRDNPRARTPVETAMLNIQRAEIEKDYANKVDALEKLGAAGDNTETALRDAQEYGAKLDDLEIIYKQSGAESGRSLQAIKMELKADFSLARMRQRLVVAKEGKPITDAEMIALNKEVKAVKEAKEKLEKEIVEKDARIAELDVDNWIRNIGEPSVPARRVHEEAKEARAAYNRLTAKFARKSESTSLMQPSQELDAATLADVEKVVRRMRDKGEKDIASAKAKLLKTWSEDAAPYIEAAWNSTGKGTANAPTRAKIISTLKKNMADGAPITEGNGIQALARQFVADGIRDRNKLVDSVHGELVKLDPSITREDVLKGIPKYGQAKLPNMEEVAAELRRMKGELREEAKLIDMANGKPPLRSGPQRGPVGPEERHLTKLVNELKKRGGFVVTDPERQLRTALEAMKTAARNRLADMRLELATGERIVRGKSQVIPDAELNALRSEIEALEVEHKAMFGKRELTEQQKLALAIKAAERSANEWERKAREGDISTKMRKPGPTSPELEAIIARREAAKAIVDELKAIANPALTPEQRGIMTWRRSKMERIAQLDDMVASGVIPPKKVKADRVLDEYDQELQFQYDRAKKSADSFIAQKKRESRTTARKFFDFTRDILNLPRSTFMTAWDWSAPGRQGLVFLTTHPIRASVALKKMVQAGLSAKQEFAINQSIQNHEAFMRAKKSGVDFTGLELGGREEEGFDSRLVRKIPVFKQGVEASQRMYTTFMNIARIETFDAMEKGLAKNGRATPEELKLFATYVNHTSGRLNKSKYDPAWNALGDVYFAPKYVASRILMALEAPVSIVKSFTPGEARRAHRVIAKEYAKFLGALVAMSGLGMLAGGKQEKDPRSTDFGKLLFGNTRVDILAGMQQFLVAMSRIVSGKSKTQSGELVNLRGDKKAFGRNVSDVWLRFVRSKLNPITGTAWDWLEGETITGEEVTLGKTAANLFTPMAARDTWEGLKDIGFPPKDATAIIKALAIGFAAHSGLGVQTYPPRQPKSSTVTIPKPPSIHAKRLYGWQ